MRRDNFTCRDCRRDDKPLNVHHCFYEKGEPWDTDMRFLLCLCEDCHFERGSMESDCKRALGLLFASIISEELAALTDSLVQNAGAMRSPVIANEFKIDHDADGRWFNYACDHKEFRKAYNAVTGHKVEWEKIK